MSLERIGMPLSLRSPDTTQALDAEGRSSAREPRANPPGSLFPRAILSRSGPVGKRSTISGAMAGGSPSGSPTGAMVGVPPMGSLG